MSYYRVTFYASAQDKKVVYTVKAENHNQACYIAHMQASTKYGAVKLVSVCLV